MVKKVRYTVRLVRGGLGEDALLRVPFAPDETVGALKTAMLARAAKAGFVAENCALSVGGAALDEDDLVEDAVDPEETITCELVGVAAPAASAPAPAGFSFAPAPAVLFTPGASSAPAAPAFSAPAASASAPAPAASAGGGFGFVFGSPASSTGTPVAKTSADFAASLGVA